MRIVGGKFRGKKIEWVSDAKTRPTKDNVRESIFNILEHAPWADGIEGKQILDIFAGTGAMGLEALSRGAANAVFVDIDRKAIELCRQNVTALNAQNQSRIMAQDALKLGQRPETISQADVVFIDPPYGGDLGQQLLVLLQQNNWLAEDCICVLEMAHDRPETIPESFTILDERKYGISKIVFIALSN